MRMRSHLAILVKHGRDDDDARCSRKAVRMD